MTFLNVNIFLGKYLARKLTIFSKNKITEMVYASLIVILLCRWFETSNPNRPLSKTELKKIKVLLLSIMLMLSILSFYVLLGGLGPQVQDMKIDLAVQKMLQQNTAPLVSCWFFFVFANMSYVLASRNWHFSHKGGTLDKEVAVILSLLFGSLFSCVHSAWCSLFIVHQKWKNNAMKNQNQRWLNFFLY